MTPEYIRDYRKRVAGRFCLCSLPAVVFRNGNFTCQRCLDLEANTPRFYVAGEREPVKAKSRANPDLEHHGIGWGPFQQLERRLSAI